MAALPVETRARAHADREARTLCFMVAGVGGDGTRLYYTGNNANGRGNAIRYDNRNRALSCLYALRANCSGATYQLLRVLRVTRANVVATERKRAIRIVSEWLRNQGISYGPGDDGQVLLESIQEDEARP